LAHALTHAVRVFRLWYNEETKPQCARIDTREERQGDAATMATRPPHSFGELLRMYRTAAGLTQEELAARAGMSARGISDLERGARRTPYRGTVDLLAEALHLTPQERSAFAKAVRRHRSP